MSQYSVSIHARQFHSGRPSILPSVASASARFNPRPPISQRATRRLADARACRHVSIHARQFHSGRQVGCSVSAMVELMFQSTPANFTAGDLKRAARSAWLMAFQSTPANFTAGDHGDGAGRRPRPVSIHARQFHSGRPTGAAGGPRAQQFQSTPANFTAGDQVSYEGWNTNPKFQSTPANFTAGDRGSRIACDQLTIVSIHARQFHSGRPIVRRAAHCRMTCFNPRPPISQRATTH